MTDIRAGRSRIAEGVKGARGKAVKKPNSESQNISQKICKRHCSCPPVSASSLKNLRARKVAREKDCMREIFHVREKSRKQKNHMEDRRDEGKQESSERVKSAGKWESASILTQLNGAVRQRDHAGLGPNQKKNGAR